MFFSLTPPQKKHKRQKGKSGQSPRLEAMLSRADVSLCVDVHLTPACSCPAPFGS